MRRNWSNPGVELLGGKVVFNDGKTFFPQLYVGFTLHFFCGRMERLYDWFASAKLGIFARFTK